MARLAAEMSSQSGAVNSGHGRGHEQEHQEDEWTHLLPEKRANEDDLRDQEEKSQRKEAQGDTCTAFGIEVDGGIDEDYGTPTNGQNEKVIEDDASSDSETQGDDFQPYGKVESTEISCSDGTVGNQRPARPQKLSRGTWKPTDISWRYILRATTCILLCGSLVPGASGQEIDYETHVLSYGNFPCDDHLPLTPWIPTQEGIRYAAMLDVFGMASGSYNYTAKYVKAHSICNFDIGTKEDPCGGLYLSHKASKVRLVLNGSDYNCGHSLSFAIVQDAPTNHLRIFADISIDGMPTTPTPTSTSTVPITDGLQITPTPTLASTVPITDIPHEDYELLFSIVVPILSLALAVCVIVGPIICWKIKKNQHVHEGPQVRYQQQHNGTRNGYITTGTGNEADEPSTSTSVQIEE